VSSRYTRWLAVPRRTLRLRLSPTGHVSLGGEEKISSSAPRQSTGLRPVQYHVSWVPLYIDRAEIQRFSQPAYEGLFLNHNGHPLVCPHTKTQV
jgi:hypothetical protein